MSIKTSSIKTKIATPTQAARADSSGGLIGAGLLGAGGIGAAIAASSPPAYAYGYQPYRHCAWQPQYNVFGQFMGHARVCY